MAPLIDAVFLLLTYFLFTISLATIEGLLPTELAMGNQFEQKKIPLEDQKDEVIIRIVQTGERVQFFIDDWPASDFESVATHLAALQPESVVVIDAGPSVAYEHVIRLYNRCLKTGIKDVVFPLTSASGGGAPRS
jgi:biopolymer transport protein ExbD